MKDFEIIVIDDASTDNTPDVIERYKKIFGHRLIYKRLRKNVGRGMVRNFGLQVASGKYITFLDADDAYCPDKIEIQSKHLDQNTNVGGVTCRYYLVNSFLAESILNSDLPSGFEILFGKSYSAFEETTGSLMVRRDIMNRVGYFDDKICRGQDTDMAVRIARISKIDFINRPLWLYRQHETNSNSMKGLRERTISNIILYKKIITSEDDSRKDLARKFSFSRLDWHIYRLREQRYFEPIIVWFLYLYEFNINLPLMKWFVVGLKTVLGNRLTQFIKRIILAGKHYPTPSIRN